MLPHAAGASGARRCNRPNSARVARLVGLQFHEDTAGGTWISQPIVERGDLSSARDFGRWLASILKAQGEAIETTERGGVVTVSPDRLACRGRELRPLPIPLKAFDAWNELWLGAPAAAHDRFPEKFRPPAAPGR